MKRKIALIGVLGAAVIMTGSLLWYELGHSISAAPRVVIVGGEAGGLPRAQPRDEHFDAAALELASKDVAAAGLQAFIVMHDDHIVFERYGRGFDAQTVIDSGSFSLVLVALAAGIAVQDNVLSLGAWSGFDPSALRRAIEAGTHQDYAQYLSSRLWRRLNGASAWIALPAASLQSVPTDCCFHARVLDWMRVAGLLLDDGHFGGPAIVPHGWVAHMRQPLSAAGDRGFGVELAAAAHGAEPFDADQVFFLRGPGRWRLWLMPTLKLAVLFGSKVPEDSSAAAPPTSLPASTSTSGGNVAVAAWFWDETRLPNLVIRALSDQPTQHTGVSQLQQLVPGH